MLDFFKRVLTWLPGKRRYLAGYDLQGNRFYEYPGQAALAGRTRRMVVYRKRLPYSEYAGERANLPVQWQAWLSRLRETPPALEELRNDQVRVQQLLKNVGVIEERDRNASALAGPTKAPPEASVLPSSPADSQSASPIQPASKREESAAKNSELRRKREEMYKSPLSGYRPVEPSADEPVSWQPSSPRRRKGAPSS